MRPSDFVNQLYDYRSNWTPLSPMTIINLTLPTVDDTNILVIYTPHLCMVTVKIIAICV